MIEVSSDVIDKIINLVKGGGGEVFEQEGYINFCGVRNPVTNNTFNDTLYIYWKEGSAFKCVKTNKFTTKPGKSWVQKGGNSGGVAIVKEGWHKDIWCHGTHNPSKPSGHKALRQTPGQTKPITITRDNSQYGKSGDYKLVINLSKQEQGTNYGVNMHRSGSPSSTYVNTWSAGCQVFGVRADFDEMMKMANYATSKGQKTFSYYLTNESVFKNSGIETGADGGKFNFDNSQYAGHVINSSNDASNYSNGSNNLDDSSSGGGSNDKTGTTSFSSFGLGTIFGTIFPNDDNNRYINMSSEDIAIIQYSEPTITVKNLDASIQNKIMTGTNAEKISNHIPLVYINDIMIPQTNITNFCLDYSSFIPQVMVEFVDMKNDMLSINVPKPGSYIKVFIGGNGDEKYYKPIRQDFVITNINKTNKTGGEYQNYKNSGNPLKYKLTGTLNVPLGFRKMSWSSSKINARQAMFNISNTVGLGFATNFVTNSNVDVMNWINSQNKSYFDFMKEITKHSCYSPYTFFTSFIDQYYVLNFVECRRLLSHGGEMTDLPQIIYNCILPDMENNKSEVADKNLNSSEQKVSYYFLTNNEDFKGWTNYIEEYYEINDGYTQLSDGSSKTLTYSDKCGFSGLSSKNYKFLLMPIDNLLRDDNKNIKSLDEEFNEHTYIPLNLRQTTTSSYVDNSVLYDNPAATETLVDFGEVDTSNNFPLYFYASVQNDFQMKNLKKCGLSVTLQNYNPSITRYSRIWVDIYDMNIYSLNQIRKKEGVDEMNESELKTFFENRNNNIITFANDLKKDNEHRSYNRSLSGWYVVTDMKISYNSVKDFKGVVSKKLQTKLVLNRIDYRPSFKSDYEMAKKGVEKYKADNIPENIVCGAGIIS
jgi:hypothetical protein